VTDHLLDTNVLLVASAAVEPRFPDVSTQPEGIDVAFEWLRHFRDDPARQMVLDECFGIYKEYQNKLTGQHFGMQVIDFKMRECLRTVPVEYDRDGYGIVPPTLDPIDNSDKKFVAAALNDPSGIHIVNATDSDWRQQRELLQQHDVHVVELLQ